MPGQTILRQTELSDLAKLSSFITSNPRMHRHLDWSPPLDWLGTQPFWLAEKNNRIEGVLAIPADPPGIAWVRLFACDPGTSAMVMWDQLFEHCLNDPALEPRSIIPSLALSDWFSSVLRRSGFEHHQDIVGLEREVQIENNALRPNPDLFVRLMEPDDLPVVAGIDQSAFEPIWQNSLRQVEQSYEQSAIATVAEREGTVIGYQISTVNMFAAHLARLAVNPALQGRQVGTTLLYDLVQRCQSERLWQITINTQDNNHASLFLYRKLGWILSGERFPVYVYQGDH